MKWSNDAWLVAPRVEEIEARARRDGRDVAEVAAEWLMRREETLKMMRNDPLRYGYEPDIWLVARAMLGMKRLPQLVRERLADRTGHDEETVWRWWSDALCDRLGMSRHVMELLVNGANRSSKTDFAAKTCHEVGAEMRQKIVIGGQMLSTSVEVQQERVWRYMPAEHRRDSRGSGVEYIKHTDKNGFTGNGFINDHGSRFSFVFYTQDKDRVFEGKEGNWYWMDEEVGIDWLKTIRYRIATVLGKCVTTFTPINGYTPAVAEYQDGMNVKRWSQGYMLPRDGGEAAPWAALGLSRAELEELRAWGAIENDRPPQTLPNSRCEDCVEWVTKPWEEIDANVEPGRVWERVPRVALCRDPQRAVIWFHGRDNPYGNPLEVIGKALGNEAARDEIKTRVYGIALKAMSKRFKKFDPEVHVIPDGETRAGVTVYREWPGAYEVPGVGVPDPWAKKSSRNKGVNDGEPDGGQTAFRFSLLRYKFEIARLERWTDYEAWRRSGRGVQMDGGWLYPDEEELKSWDEANGSAERVAARFVDGRAAQGSKIGMREDKTLLDLLNELGMVWFPASGRDIGSGEERVTAWLDWDRGADGALAREPLIHFCAGAVNHVFAMRNYMGVDGQKGACKEPVDTLRYLAQSGLVESVMGGERAGGTPAVPGGGGITVCVLDPAPERNWFLGWYRIVGEVRGKREEVIGGEDGRRDACGPRGAGLCEETGVRGDRPLREVMRREDDGWGCGR